ncbi:MAG: phenylalanine--tRNA ligase subunit beta, partial [Campylobacteraceae bacterium]
HDVENMQDIAEEIVRIVGIDNIEAKPLIFSEKIRINKTLVDFEKRKFYRFKAVAAGYFESVHYVFDDRVRSESYGFECIAKEKDLLNPITTELNTLRVTLALNLLDAVSKNQNAGFKSANLFEVGRVFDKNRNESLKVAFVSSGFSEEPSVENHGKPSEYDFFSFASKITQIIGNFKVVKASPKNRLFSPYEYGLIEQNGEILGEIGRLNPNNSFGLARAYICEVDFEKLVYKRKMFTSYSKLPSVSRDLSVLVPKTLEYKKIEDCIKSCNIKELSKFYPIDTYSDEKLGDKLSLTITLNFIPEAKTFEDEDINAMINKILENLKNQLEVSIR